MWTPKKRKRERRAGTTLAVAAGLFSILVLMALLGQLMIWAGCVPRQR